MMSIFKINMVSSRGDFWRDYRAKNNYENIFFVIIYRNKKIYVANYKNDFRILSS